MTRKEKWEEFENQLKREIHTPITMSYDDSIRLAELGIEETVARWKPRLEQEPKKGHWVCLEDEYGDVVDAVCSNCGANGNPDYMHYCPNCGARMKGGE